MIAEDLLQILRVKTEFKTFKQNLGYLPATQRFATSGSSSGVPRQETQEDTFLGPLPDRFGFEAMSAGTTPVALHMKDTNFIPDIERMGYFGSS